MRPTDDPRGPKVTQPKLSSGDTASNCVSGSFWIAMVLGFVGGFFGGPMAGGFVFVLMFPVIMVFSFCQLYAQRRDAGWYDKPHTPRVPTHLSYGGEPHPAQQIGDRD